jgi:hypothetical protein
VAVKPLVVNPELAPLALYRYTVIWMTLGLLWEAVAGTTRGRILYLLFVPAVWVARIVIVDAVLSPAEVVGGLLAIALWAGMSRFSGRVVIVGALLTVLLVLESLAPFRFSSVARSFQWIPFYSFMHGSIITNVLAFFEKAFLYGSWVWVMHRAGVPLGITGTVGALLLLGLRLAQVYLPGRSAEVTDMVILLALTGLMELIPDEGPSVISSTPRGAPV